MLAMPVVLRTVNLIRPLTVTLIMLVSIFILTLIVFIFVEHYNNNTNHAKYDIIYIDYPLIKTNYSLRLDKGEIGSKIILIGSPVNNCSFNASFTNINNNSWLTIGLINQGNYKYASFEKRYGIDFRAMVYNKNQFLNTLSSDDKELSSDYTLNEYYNNTESMHNYKINVTKDSVLFYIDNELVATIKDNIPKNDNLFFHLQVSNIENNKPLEQALFLTVTDIEVN